ncbi:MAG: DUF1851 domain-containing protein [Deltaproteobacteria bacterium]|nr:DUF1851 domain-containing protein [Deltaproteobacteria bacterium]
MNELRDDLRLGDSGGEIRVMTLPRFEKAYAMSRMRPLSEEETAASALPDLGGLREFARSYGGASFGGGVYRTHSALEMEKWTALVGEAFPEQRDHIVCFAFDWMGRQYAIDSSRRVGGTPGVLLFDPATVKSFEVPATLETLHEEELADHGVEDLAVPFFQEWIASGGSAPRHDQCVGYKKPLFLGGDDDVTNLEITDMEVYWAISTQIWEQVKGLPPGTKIGSVSFGNE